MATERGLTRRSFVQSITTIVAAAFGSSFLWLARASADPAQAVLRSRPHKKTEDAKTGMQPLGLGSDRDGFIYIPTTYSPEKPTPLLVLLHGALARNQQRRFVQRAHCFLAGIHCARTQERGRRGFLSRTARRIRFYQSTRLAEPSFLS
jgi:hypothetical protein